MMTQRNFEDVAKAMRDLKPDKERDKDGILLADHILWTKVVHRLGMEFASDNPRFKWDVFLTACKEPKAFRGNHVTSGK